MLSGMIEPELGLISSISRVLIVNRLPDAST